MSGPMTLSIMKNSTYPKDSTESKECLIQVETLPVSKANAPDASVSDQSYCIPHTNSTIQTSPSRWNVCTFPSNRYGRATFAELNTKISELGEFLFFTLLFGLILVLAVSDWIFLFKYVIEPEVFSERIQWAAIWIVSTFGLVQFRQIIHSKMDPNMKTVALHGEIFVLMSLIMVFSANIAFYFHIPSVTPLHDLGFMLVPEQALHSPWRPISDVLTSLVPVFFFIQSFWLPRENRCRILTSFFRIGTASYFFRMCTISLTSLPGPAPHCRPGYVEYRPPETWIDIVTLVGPIYGNYKSCGDLIFSGHMAFSTTAVLLYLRVLDRYHTGFSRARWIVGAIYLIGLSALLLAGRKHYTVDVVLGVLIASLSYFHFEHGWIPLAIQHPDGLIAYRARHKHSADTTNSIDFMSLNSIESLPKLPIRKLERMV
uniref:Transmembrane protein putative n=1 Tax=Albugo laibachii Nc14 TaxID=890382 RepID=F0WUI2_9STRA|nr:transmembrane protein putative [Albugo laibachii Nc14]|eukprot:CCA25063.1 transmembrane protein putative [Albugo laibachii Nc14]